MSILLAAAVLFACDPVKNNPPQFETKEKTVLVYMVANNDLSSNAYNNLSDLKKGHIPDNGNILVYFHTPQTSPLLLNVCKDDKGEVIQDTVYRFPSRNSAEPESLTSAMKVVATMFPAEEYGLFLWSHGTGWLPSGRYSKSFGSDNGVEMDIAELAEAIPYKLSFVVFDACLMGSVEVAYELKDSVDYVISSPTEIRDLGFPYSRVMQHIFRSPSDLQAVAKEYYDYYNAFAGQARSASISLVKTSELDGVAQAAAEIFGKYREELAVFNPAYVQRYFRGTRHWFYDLGDYVNLLAPQDAAEFNEAMEKAVIYKAATPKFFDITINPQKFSGLSVYIPSVAEDPQLDAYYASLKWNMDTKLVDLQQEEE